MSSPPETTCPSRHVWEYGREKLHETLAAVDGDGADLEVLAPLELALMAFALTFGASEAITLDPADVIEYVNDANEPGPACTCPPSLVARGGFRSSCPVHGTGDA